MGCCVNKCVYPVPNRDCAADALRSHPDLVWLVTESRHRIPALYLKSQGRRRSGRVDTSAVSPLSGIGMEQSVLVEDASEVPGLQITCTEPTERRATRLDAEECGLRTRPSLRSSVSGRSSVSSLADEFPEVLQERCLTLLVFHGNAESLGLNIAEYAELCHRTRCDVFAVEFDGYSIAEGKPSERATYEDAEAGLAHLRQCGVDMADVIIFGRSLGTGPSVELASRYPSSFGGMVLQSPLSSILKTQAVCTCGCSVVLKKADMYRSFAKIGAITFPVMIVHGMKDRVVPFRCGRELHGLLRNPQPPVWVPNAGHNDVQDKMGRREYFTKLRHFINTVRQTAKVVSVCPLDPGARESPSPSPCGGDRQDTLPITSFQ